MQAPLNFSPYLRLIQKTGATKHPYGFSATDLLLKRANLSGDAHLLDVGCGAGHTSAYIAQNYGCTVMGVDISSDAVDHARSLHAREPYAKLLQFLVADAHSLPFDDGQFDVVVCESVLFFIHDKEAALKEMARVLKPKGYLALNEIIVADSPKKRAIQDYFLREEFGGFLVTADDVREAMSTTKWSILLEDEKPFDLMLQLKAEFKNLLSLKSLLPLLEMAHQACVSKEMRDDLFKVIKFSLDMPKGLKEHLYSYLLLAQKKPLRKAASPRNA